MTNKKKTYTNKTCLGFDDVAGRSVHFDSMGSFPSRMLSPHHTSHLQSGSLLLARFASDRKDGVCHEQILFLRRHVGTFDIIDVAAAVHAVHMDHPQRWRQSRAKHLLEETFGDLASVEKSQKGIGLNLWIFCGCHITRCSVFLANCEEVSMLIRKGASSKQNTCQSSKNIKVDIS